MRPPAPQPLAFVPAFPANQYELIVRARQPCRDRALAFGFDVGGRVALVDPQRIASGRGARIVLQLVYPIGWSMPHLSLLRCSCCDSAASAAAGFRAWSDARRTLSSRPPARR